MASDLKVNLEISANTPGSEKINALSMEMLALESSIEKTSQGAQVLQGLRKEIETLGQQQSAISNFKALKLAVDDADSSFKAAQTIAQGLGSELSRTTDASADQKREFAAARAEVNTTQAAWQSATVALQNARSALSASGVDTKQLAGAQVTLKADVNATAEQLNQLKTALGEAGSSMGQARASAEQTGLALEQAFKTLGVS